MVEFFRKTFLWIVALSIINSSIDVMEHDLPPSYAGQNTEEIDEIESLVEMLYTVASGNESSLPETNNDQQKLVKKSVTVDYSLPVRKMSIAPDILALLNARPSIVSGSNTLPAGFWDLFTPPPDRC